MQKNMRNFTYYTPTKVVFGKDAELQVAKLIQAGGSFRRKKRKGIGIA